MTVYFVKEKLHILKKKRIQFFFILSKRLQCKFSIIYQKSVNILGDLVCRIFNNKDQINKLKSHLKYSDIYMYEELEVGVFGPACFGDL